MRLISLRSKRIFWGVVLILLFILIVLTIIAFTPVNSNLKTVNLCAPFSKESGEISCEEAVKQATADTKGKVKNIAIGFLAPNPALEGATGNSKKQMWLIEIDLENPFTAPNGEEIKSLQIIIPIDGANMLYRTPIKT